MLKRLSELVLHPFILVALQVVVCLVFVKALALPEEVIPIFVILEIAAALVLLISWLLTRDIYRAGVASSLALFLFFYYRTIALTVEALWQEMTGAKPPEAVSLCVWLVLTLTCVASSTKTTWNFGKNSFEIDHLALTRALNAVLSLLLAFNLFNLAVFEIQDYQLAQKYIKQLRFAFDGTKFDTTAAKPDVYYLLIDGFPHKDTLSETLKSNDHSLYDYLESKGFYVVPCAASNYDRTEFSLASSLNMQHVHDIGEELGKKYDGLNMFSRLVQNSAVAHIFKDKLGYKFINTASASSVTDWMPDADRTIRPTPLNQYVVAMMALTPVMDLEPYTHMLRDLIVQLRLGAGDSLAQAARLPGPKFVYCHTEIAHSPILFDADGRRRAIPPGHFAIDWGGPGELQGQLSYTQKTVISWLDDLFKETQGKAVIIIQSDHGPGVFIKNDDDRLNERMRNLNAYYFPGKGTDGLYPTITPVNSFRVLFNDYFHTNLEMLPDDVWWAPDYARGFDWVNVRTRLHFSSNCK